MKGHDERFCTDCGNIIKIKAEICPHCGIRQQPEPKQTKSKGKTKSMAILLALFFGGIGLHRFYLGRPISGVFYILFCWTMCTYLIALVEVIVFAFQSDESFNKNYN